MWTGLVMMNIASLGVHSTQQAFEVDYRTAIPARAIDWYSCAVFTPLFIWLARRYPIDRASWRTHLPAWLLVTIAVTPAKFVIQYHASALIVPEANAGRTLAGLIVSGFIMELVAFWAMAGVILSIEYHERWRERDLQAAMLSQQLVQARFDTLSAQLRPHFLFNTLQGISTLLHRDVRAADRMLGRLGELLRGTLQVGAAPEISLEREFALVEHYVAIQRIRFEDRLSVQMNMDGAHRALVPNFILQPLVENAIEHGIARSAAGGTITIDAERRADRLLLRVRDDATDRTGKAEGAGIGLANTRARLETLYGMDARLETRENATGGFVVTIELPYREAAK